MKDAARKCLIVLTSVSPVLVLSLNCLAADVSQTAAGLRLSVETRKKFYAAEDRIDLVVLLQNLRSENVAIVDQDPMATYELKVIRVQSQKEAPLTLYGQNARRGAEEIIHRRRSRLPPGQTITNTFHLNRLFDMTVSGEYEVSVSRRGVPGALTSNTIKLAVAD
jgi:hypothetical protein